MIYLDSRNLRISGAKYVLLQKSQTMKSKLTAADGNRTP